MSSADTIYALATAPGKSGVAVIRISGMQALAALQLLAGQGDIRPRYAHYVTFRIPGKGEIIDRGLALYFPAPHSFTGEEVVECQLHGSLAVVRQMLETLGTIDGLRPAEAGEFTRRAFTNGKMDLVEAEGLADLVDAETGQQKLQALRQMRGELSFTYDNIRTAVIQCLALLEAYIDFPDEDIPASVLDALEADSMLLRASIASMLDDERRGERLRDGINVVILGAPNVGKSSLLNAIAKRDVAIVSHRAGTTRDIIEIHLDLAGYPVVFVDTAGLRESDDDIEVEGIRRAQARAQSADIKLVLFDGGLWPERDAASVQLLDGQAIAVVNKCDLLCHPVGGEAAAQDLQPVLQDPAQSLRASQDFYFISTKTGEGVENLLKLIEQRIIAHYSSHLNPVITRSRHRTHLGEALRSLDNSMIKTDIELRCEELRQAALAVGKITGKIQVDDVLDVIFKRFCIGK